MLLVLLAPKTFEMELKKSNTKKPKTDKPLLKLFKNKLVD